VKWAFLQALCFQDISTYKTYEMKPRKGFPDINSVKGLVEKQKRNQKNWGFARGRGSEEKLGSGPPGTCGNHPSHIYRLYTG
jgi:hypothetical protein